MSKCIDKHFNQIVIGDKTLCAICLNEQNERLINENAQLLAENTVQWRELKDLQAKLAAAEQEIERRGKLIESVQFDRDVEVGKRSAVEKELTTLRQYREEDIKMRLLANKLKNGEIKINESGLVFKDNGDDLERELQEELEQIQYAELGRLAMNLDECFCPCKYGSEECGVYDCSESLQVFCKKRTELLAEGCEP